MRFAPNRPHESSGARCGVYTLIVHDTRTPLPAGAHLDEVVANSVNLVQAGPSLRIGP